MDANDHRGLWKDLSHNFEPLFLKKHNASSLQAQFQQGEGAHGDMEILMEALPELAKQDIAER